MLVSIGARSRATSFPQPLCQQAFVLYSIYYPGIISPRSAALPVPGRSVHQPGLDNQHLLLYSSQH